MDFDKLTEKTKSFLQAAQTLALRSGHQSLEPEHLLKVMLDDDTGMVQKLLQSVGGDLTRLKRDLEAAIAKFPVVGGPGAGGLRLERAHDTLLAAIPGSTTVTEVALRWGFPHLGEFAARYSARFGEKPSETLARLPH